MVARDRILAAFRARFWLHIWHEHIAMLCKKLPDLYSMKRSFISPQSFHILNRLCDTLVLLTLAYAEVYPSTLFCPWLCTTAFVEHFFGIARQLLPDFTYAEFLHMVQHIMVRQRILESGLVRSKRDHTSATGYIFDEDADFQKRSTDPIPTAKVTRAEIDAAVTVAFAEASSLCKDVLHMSIPSVQSGKRLKLQSLGSILGKQRLDAKKPASSSESRKDDAYESDDTPWEDEEDDDYDSESDETKETPALPQRIVPGQPLSAPQSQLDKAVAVAAVSTARSSALADDLDDLIDEADVNRGDIGLPAPHPLPQASDNSLNSELERPSAMRSEVLDLHTGKFSISLALKQRRQWQSGTAVNSERVIKVHKKYIKLSRLSETSDSTSNPKESSDAESLVPEKMSIKEASHRLRVAQELNPELKKQERQLARHIRWKEAIKGLKEIIPAASDSEIHPSLHDSPPLTSRTRVASPWRAQYHIVAAAQTIHICCHADRSTILHWRSA